MIILKLFEGVDIHKCKIYLHNKSYIMHITHWNFWNLYGIITRTSFFIYSENYYRSNLDRLKCRYFNLFCLNILELIFWPFNNMIKNYHGDPLCMRMPSCKEIATPLLFLGIDWLTLKMMAGHKQQVLVLWHFQVR